MEKLLDKIVTVIFVIALLAILYFVGKYVMDKMGAKSTADNMEQIDDNDPFSDADDVDDTFDSEDADYYGDDPKDGEAVPEGYDDEIAKIMENVVSDSEEKVASAADAVSDGAKNMGDAAAASTKSVADGLNGDRSAKESKDDDEKEEESEAASSNKSDSATIDDDNRYMVVAGSFTSNANADKHASKLEKVGFTPEIVNFNNSRMYTVVASRYDSESDALAAAKKLRAKKIDCYVHRKRQK